MHMVGELDPKKYIGVVLDGRFTIDRLVGKGGFAWVYHATTDDNDEAAIKVLHTSDRTATLRFARETRVLQALPPTSAVAGWLGHGDTPDGLPYLALEFVDGITLQQGLDRCQLLEPAKAVAFVAELCVAFGGLHQLGVAHRDVKPENILLARRGGIKLVDFGLIRDAQGLLKLFESEDPLQSPVFADELDYRILAGTPEYMAPEQFADAAARDLSAVRTDTWSDVFSLGVILYQLINGRTPFPMRAVPPEKYPGEILRYMRWRTSIGDDDIPPSPDTDDALDSIIRKALRRDPGLRQPDARVLESDLRRYIATGRGVSNTEVTRTINIDINAIDGTLSKDTASVGLHEAQTNIVNLPDEGLHDAKTTITGPFLMAETIPEAPLSERDETEDHPAPTKSVAAKVARRWPEAPTIEDPLPKHLLRSSDDDD